MSGRGYLGEVGLGLDRLANAALGGSADHSISASIGAQAAQGKWWAKKLERLVDWCFIVFRRAPDGHCRRQAVREALLPG